MGAIISAGMIRILLLGNVGGRHSEGWRLGQTDLKYHGVTMTSARYDVTRKTVVLHKDDWLMSSKNNPDHDACHDKVLALFESNLA